MDKITCSKCRCKRTPDQYDTHPDGSRYKTCRRCISAMSAQRECMKGTSEDRRHWAHIGRIPKTAKLTVDDVRLIRQMQNFPGRHGAGVTTASQLAEKFEVSESTICSIWAGRTWSAHW